MEKTVRTAIQPNFEKNGYIFNTVKDYGNYKLYTLTRKKDGKVLGYEMVKPEKYTNPDGSVILVYPSTAHWGGNGWSFPMAVGIDYIEQRMKSRFPDFP